MNNCFPSSYREKQEMLSWRRTVNKRLEIQTPSRGGCQNVEMFCQSNELCWSHSCNKLSLTKRQTHLRSFILEKLLQSAVNLLRNSIIISCACSWCENVRWFSRFRCFQHNVLWKMWHVRLKYFIAYCKSAWVISVSTEPAGLFPLWHKIMVVRELSIQI